jgi:hypothetical protein
MKDIYELGSSGFTSKILREKQDRFKKMSDEMTMDVSNLQAGFFVILGVDSDQTTKYSARWVKL